MMIWLLLGCMALVSALFIFAPLYQNSGLSENKESEVRAYLAEISALEIRIESGDADPQLPARKAELERQILAQSKLDMSGDDRMPRGALGALFALMVGAGFALYAVIGRPDLSQPQIQTQTQNIIDPAALDTMSIEGLSAQLRAKLEANPNQPEGWLLYARSLMQLRSYDKALAAYQRAMETSGNNENVAAELARASEFVEQQLQAVSPITPQIKGPNQEQVEAAAQMSDDDRVAFISSMVEGLALKLEDNPNDAQGWIRLLGARGVLGQDSQIAVDIETLKAQFKDDPETLAAIFSAANVTP